MLAADPEHTCVLTDFDGTLAPIVGDPEDAAPVPGVVEVLHALARRFRTVAVVSGRPASFLVPRLGIGDGRSGLRAVGSYGAEQVDADGTVHSRLASPEEHEAVELAAAALEAGAGPGVEVERKRWSVAVHWRAAPSLAPASEELAARTARRFGLAVHPARMAAELMVPGAPDKGSAVAALALGASAACFLGDDSGDLPAFAALEEMRQGGRARTVSVAVASDESPRGLVEAADLVLDGPAQAAAFLATLAALAGAS